MKKEELLKQIMALKHWEYRLITFHNQEMTICFQWLGNNDLKKFINYNFKIHGIKNVKSLEITEHDCLVVRI